MTPRKPGSAWSESNRKRVKKLIAQELMTKAGLEKVKEGKRSGTWTGQDRPVIPSEVPAELKRALARNKKAGTFFDSLAPTYRKQFVAWVHVAKRKETRDRRVKESIALLERGKKLGLK
jgi:uncharacterized protein YdeI (YjbR/CyaY-like superfamily)